MTRVALAHEYPRWETPEDDPSGDPVEYWYGRARIVRNRRRMRKLKRRGVPLLDCRAKLRGGYSGEYCWMWFTPREG